MMGWWEERVVPRLIDLTCGGELTAPWRRAVCAPVAGEVIELGFGSGRNLEHYGEGVSRVLAVEPSDMAWQMARERIAAFERPVKPPNRSRSSSIDLWSRLMLETTATVGS